MKNVKTLACMSAVALASIVGFSSCGGDNNGANLPEQNREAVKTEFSIALPNQLSGSNRMPSANVQVNGFDDFQGMTGITLIPFAGQDSIQGAYTRIGDNILLADLVKADLKHEDIEKYSKAKVYLDVNVPLTTSSFLFYAKSLASGTKFQTGSLIDAGLTSANPSGISFSLDPILTVDPTSLYLSSSSKGAKLLKYLTNVANASDGTTKWCAYDPNDPAQASMRTVFDTLATTRALSSFEIERIMSDLYKSLYATTSPIANAIKDSIANSTYANVDGTTHEVTLVSALQDFPQEYDIPEGCINSKWNASSRKFEADLNDLVPLDKYVYPAQLWYYVNSVIKTSNSSKKDMYASAYNTWQAILDAHTDAPTVNARTRAIAINDQIQYAVAHFDVQVKCASATLRDNSDRVGDREDVDVDPDGFPVTAILVGGQKNVGYNFEPNGSVAYTIFDKQMSDANMAAAAGPYSASNHTLVLESDNNDVMIAVEMINNTGKDFYGNGNQLIPAGGKFYVVAQLEAAEASRTGGHVFKQDYTTYAKLTLANLRSAYNTIPDLRTPELELGFSVNLDWQQGNTYEINFQ